MSFVQTLNYDTAGNFTFDTSKIAIVGSSAQLNLINFPAQIFSQNYSSSAGFIFDPTKTEFVGGVMRQKNSRPTDALFYSQLTSGPNATWNTGGSLVGTATGQVTYGATGANFSAAVTQYLDYNAASNLTAQIGTIRFLFTPFFTGAPGDNEFLMLSSLASGSINGLVDTYIDAAGNIHFRAWDSAGGALFDISTAISWVANQTYEIEVDYDFDNGASRLFLDGVQQSTTQSSVANRGSVTYLRFGTAFIPQGSVGNFAISNVVTFSTVQHTSNYSAPSPLPSPTIYAADEITLPAFNYAGIGDIISFDSATITDSNTPHYLLNGRYWNGSAWVVSNLSYAQSNTAAQVIANITSFPISDMVSVKVITQASDATVMSCDLLTLTYTGQMYPLTNPTIINNSGVQSDDLVSFLSTFSASGSDAIQFTINVSGIDKYWNGAAWATSNGTYAQSNSYADIIANIATLNISQGYTVKVKAFLHSADGTTTPQLTNVVLTYDFFTPSPTDPNRCVGYAFLNDLIGELTPTENTLLIVELTEGFVYGDRIIAPFIRKFAADSSGYVETTSGYLQTEDSTASPNGIVESETNDVSPYKITIQYTNGDGNQVNLVTDGIQIPNQLSVNLATLLTNLSP